jgi:hypothetical protein
VFRSIRTATTQARRSTKRHIAVDTQGLLLLSVVHGADMQDPDGGILLMSLMFAANRAAPAHQQKTTDPHRR